MLRMILKLGPVGVIAILTAWFVWVNWEIMGVMKSVMFSLISVMTIVLMIMIGLGKLYRNPYVITSLMIAGVLYMEWRKTVFMPGGLYSVLPYPDTQIERMLFWFVNDCAAMLFIAVGMLASRRLEQRRVGG